MGMLGRWIDQAVMANPELMERVLDRPFGTLAHWFDTDEEGDSCGCLIGSTALEAGYNVELLGIHELTIGVMLQASGFGFDATVVGHRSALLAIRLSGKRWTGRPYDQYVTPEGDALAIGLIKARLARRLAALEVYD